MATSFKITEIQEKGKKWGGDSQKQVCDSSLFA